MQVNSSMSDNPDYEEIKEKILKAKKDLDEKDNPLRGGGQNPGNLKEKSKEPEEEAEENKEK